MYASFPPPAGIRVWAGQEDLGAGQVSRHGGRGFGSIVHAKLLPGRGAPRSTEEAVGRRGRKLDHCLGQRARGASVYPLTNPPDDIGSGSIARFTTCGVYDVSFTLIGYTWY